MTFLIVFPRSSFHMTLDHIICMGKNVLSLRVYFPSNQRGCVCGGGGGGGVREVQGPGLGPACLLLTDHLKSNSQC